ncbi:MAG: DUF2283 domain-containing protein [Gemmatimonadetes bacterium]|nr:DUF2283 domain-containing protein [Gemmatimonadota bacterium]
MEALKMLEKSKTIDWEYDAKADVLYLSLGDPRPAIGVDIGDGLIVRYDEKKAEVLGLTVVGLRARLAKQLETSSGE